MQRTISMIAGLWSVMTILALVGPAGARAPTTEPSRRPSLASGRQLFMGHCARCHGADAMGKRGPALTGRSLNQDEIEEMVSAGQPAKMPAFGKRLSSAEITAVAAYVRSLGGRR